MKKIYFFSILIFVLFVANAYAQPTGSGPSVTITVISSSPHSFGPSSPDPNKVNVDEEVRDPTPDDIIKGVKGKAQVAITIPQSNDTARWAHTMRVRAVNLTTYNGTNEDNKTVYYNDIKVYDPTTGKNYTTQMAMVDGDPKGYVYWYGWVQIRDVIIIKSHVPPKPGRGLFHAKPGHLGLLPLIGFKDLFLPKFH